MPIGRNPTASLTDSMYRFSSALQVEINGGNGSTEISVNQDPTVRAWFPSVKLGLIVYLW